MTTATATGAPAKSAPAFPVECLEAFAAQLPRESAVLCADTRVAQWLARRGVGCTEIPADKDVRFLNAAKSSVNGIWLASHLSLHSIEDAQRVIAICFQGLKPGGAVFAAHEYSSSGFASLLRQNGFQIVEEAQSDGWTAVVARRI